MAFLEIEDQNGEAISIPVFQSFWKVIKDVFVEGKVHMMNLYLDKENDQVMFWSQGICKKRN